MVVDYGLLREVVERFDHCDLNAQPDFDRNKLPTTAENIAVVLATKLQTAVGDRVSIDEVVVRETPRAAAKWKKN